MYHVSQKTAPFYFCNNSLKPSSIFIIFGSRIYLSKFLIQAYFTFFINLKAESQLKFQQHSEPAQRVRTTVKRLRCETRDFTAPNLWFLNISNFSHVDYMILVMLQECVCQNPVREATSD